MMKVAKKKNLSSQNGQITFLSILIDEQPNFRKHTEKLTSDCCEINQNQIVFQFFFPHE